MLRFDNKVSSGNIITVAILILGAITAYFDLYRDVQLLTAAQANQTRTETEHYSAVLEELREIKQDVKELRKEVHNAK